MTDDLPETVDPAGVNPAGVNPAGVDPEGVGPEGVGPERAHREAATHDDDELAGFPTGNEPEEIPTRIDTKALTFEPELLASPPLEDMHVGLADLDEDLRTMTQNNHEVERWRRLSTRGLERASSLGSDEPPTVEQDLSDVTDVQRQALPRDALRPAPMYPMRHDADTVEQALDEPSEEASLGSTSQTTSPGVLRAELTPVPRPSARASRSFGAPRESGSRSSDVSVLRAQLSASESADRTAPFPTLPAQLLARSARPSAPPPEAGGWAPSSAPISQPPQRVPSVQPGKPMAERPSVRPAFVPRPSSAPVETTRGDLTPTQFVRSPLLPNDDAAPETEIAGIPQSYVVAGLLVFALFIVLATWWVVH